VAITENVLTLAKVEEAIGYIEEAHKIHAEWISYLTDYPEAAATPCTQVDVAGDSVHHQQWNQKYDMVLAVLRAVKAGLHD
jgi:hypothetical protein